MVDFQSRDTNRNRGNDDGDDSQAADDGGAQTDHGQDSDGHDHGSDHNHSHDHGSDHNHSHDHGSDHDHGIDVDQLSVAIVTVSSTRSLEDDPSGDVAQTVVEGADYEVATRDLVRDDLDSIQSTVQTLARRDDVDTVILTGGTGVTPDDVTVEAVRGLFDKVLPGFGELFRSLSYDEIGTRVVATRATAGIVDEVPVFCLPGSDNAVRLGTEEIIVPEVGHLAGLARREH